MGGGAAIRVAGKIVGFVKGSLRGGYTAIALPENLTSAACKAKTTRPVTGIFSSSGTQIEAVSSSTVTKPCYEIEECESEVSSDVGEPLPRLVFGGAPTFEEAKDATFELRTALDHGGSYASDEEHDKLAVSDSGHLESKACVTKASASTNVIRAFRLLKESPAVQTVVASIASDPNVWNAVSQNEAILAYYHSQNTGMNDSLKESTAGAEIPVYQFAKYANDAMFDEESELKNGFNKFLQDIKLKAVEMMSSLSGFFQNLFAGPGADDGSPKGDPIGASIMGLAIMVIMVVVFKRV